MFRIIGDTNIDFIGARKIAFGFSSVLVAIGIYAFAMTLLGNANLGIDFAGGVMLQGHFEQEVKIDELRSALLPDFPDVAVTEVSGFELPNAFIIKTKRPESEKEGSARLTKLVSILADQFPGNAFSRDSEHVIGPAVGQSLRSDAQKAIFISLIGIMIYIWIRFDIRSGAAATIATFHDVLAVFGIMFLLGKEIDLLLVTALLTLAGYSLTDTVVVFDRVRENLRRHRSKADFVPAINRAINETLARTFNTSITVLFVVGAIFFFGGPVLHDFSLALILGVIIGTYSSVFVASPIVVEWEDRRPKRFK